MGIAPGLTSLQFPYVSLRRANHELALGLISHGSVVQHLSSVGRSHFFACCLLGHIMLQWLYQLERDMKKNEMREISIYYCDVCGKECGLPYYGSDNNDNKGYGNCCDPKMNKAERYLTAINKIRETYDIPLIELTFETLAEASKQWVGERFNLRRAK